MKKIIMILTAILISTTCYCQITINGYDGMVRLTVDTLTNEIYKCVATKNRNNKEITITKEIINNIEKGIYTLYDSKKDIVCKYVVKGNKKNKEIVKDIIDIIKKKEDNRNLNIPLECFIN